MSEQIPLVAVLGAPIAHSKSPIIHHHWLSAHRLRGHYVPIYANEAMLKDTLHAMRQLGFVGANVTVPNKERMFELCDTLSPQARRVKAVNTIQLRDNGEVYGDNTDVYGFITNLKMGVGGASFAGQTALVLGAGGASRAVITALLDEGLAQINLSNRTLARAEELAGEFGPKIDVVDWNERSDVVPLADVIINTTKLGMKGEAPLEIDLSALRKGAVVNDIVYTPLMTPLLQEAARSGGRVVDGLDMLLYQAVPGFEMWFGQRPVVDEALRQKLLSA